MRVATASAAAMQAQRSQQSQQSEGIMRRSWHTVFSPFSSTALKALPDTSQRNRDRAPRADRIPDTTDNESGRETVIRNYQSINQQQHEPPISVRVPAKIPTPIKVEGKVWFANERSGCLRTLFLAIVTDKFVAWLSYLNMGVLLGTLALALFNASEDTVARNFGVFYAVISIGVLVGTTLAGAK